MARVLCRYTSPTWRVRSATVQPGQLGTAAVGSVGTTARRRAKSAARQSSNRASSMRTVQHTLSARAASPAAGSGRRLPLAVVGGEGLLGRDLDAGLVEGDLEAGPELAGHLPLLERAGLGHQADPDAVGAELLDPPDLRLLQEPGRPVLVDVQLLGDPLDRPGGVVEVGRVGDLD